MTKVTEGGFKVDPKNGIPAWIQVRRRLVFLILSGKFQPNEQVPTVRELAVELGINYNTVNKVYQDLERDGLLRIENGRGTFVADSSQLDTLSYENSVDLLADELIEKGFASGMTEADILDTITSRFKLRGNHR